MSVVLSFKASRIAFFILSVLWVLVKSTCNGITLLSFNIFVLLNRAIIVLELSFLYLSSSGFASSLFAQLIM